MLRLHLAVDEPEAPSLELPYQVHQRDLRPVRAAREHRLAEERAPDCDAVEPACQFAVHPRLDRVRHPGRVQPFVRGDHAAIDPRARLRVARSGARADDLTERGVGGDADSRPSSCASPSDFATCSSAGNSTIRGSGLHHRMGSPSLNHGKMPCAYASISVPTERLRPIASRPFGLRSARSSGGNGSRGPRTGTMLSPRHSSTCCTPAASVTMPVRHLMRDTSGGALRSAVHVCHRGHVDPMGEWVAGEREGKRHGRQQGA